MKHIESIVKEVAEIYRKNGNDAEEYLRKARKLKGKFGSGPAIVYCWFYSVPQKWTQVEPKVFELMKKMNYFDLDTMLATSTQSLALMLKPMIFCNNIAKQLIRFCEAIKGEYGSWKGLGNALGKDSIFTLFETLRRFKGIRLTLKNLAAMKIFVGMEDNLLILDIHLAEVLGINKNEIDKYRVREAYFKELLKKSEEITDKLRTTSGDEIQTVKWSLAIWFEKARISANKLLFDVI
jgi:endonuclease III-like uncharacterized protein